MSDVELAWIIVLSLGFGLILPLLIGYLMSWFVTKGLYFGWFVRTTPNKYPRETPSCAEANQVKMFNDGLAFRDEEKDVIRPVSITSDGLHLEGLYLDYKAERSVIIIPGRSETSSYSFFYAQLYKNKGYNVLLIDSRATGISEGKFMTAGIKESSDLLSWAEFLHQAKGQEAVVFHGICIGAATALLALAKPNLPPYIKGAVAEGSFKNFRRMFEYHVKTSHHPSFTISHELPFYFKRYAEVDILKDSPEKMVSRITLPVSFIHGEEDIYVPDSDGEELYRDCGSKEKEFHRIETGEHSKLRYYHPQEYDQLVLSFFDKITGPSLK